MQIDEGIDILSPELRTVNGSVYRVLCTRPSDLSNTCATNTNTGHSQFQEKTRREETWKSDAAAGARDPYEDEPNTCKAALSESRCEPTKPEWSIKEITTPAYFHKYIVGRGGTVKNKLERETGTMIDVPKPRDNKDFVRVKYQSEEALSSVQFRIESIVESAKKRERPTHFVCIPVRSPAITENLAKFRKLCTEESISPQIVQIPSKLHVTFGVLKLFSEKEVSAAQDALSQFASQIPYILCRKPLRASLRKLEIMNDDPRSVRVLYSELVLLDNSERLQNLANQCFQFFVDKGLMSEELNRNSSSIKIHCTLINTRWGITDKQAHGPIDATRILSEDFGIQNFGECVLEKLNLSEMSSDRNKEYRNISSVNLIS